MAEVVLIRGARVLTLAGEARPRRGAALGELGVLPEADVLIAEGKVAAVGKALPAPPEAWVIEAEGRVLMPGFVDCHTHLCWAGSRVDEWEQIRRGVPYLQILSQGGGIHSTVKAVRETSEEALAELTLGRLQVMLREGTTTAEVKSGYGLTALDETKMLRAIAAAARQWPGTVVPTALLGHAFEGDHDVFAARTIHETLPVVSRPFPGITIDAFCEKKAWTREACEWLFEEAKARGHPFRVHADQFNSMGMIPAAVKLGARSVDHLEATMDRDLEILAESETFGVILPGTGFHAGGGYARGRTFVDLGGALALATNCNPGSSPSSSMPFAISLAVRMCGLSPAEAIVACTYNAASLLGLADRGSIEVGKRADLILLRHEDERMLAYETGGNPVAQVVCGGTII